MPQLPDPVTKDPTPHITDADLKNYLEPLYTRCWGIAPSHRDRKKVQTLSKTFIFKGFPEAVSFVQDVAAIVQSENVCIDCYPAPECQPKYPSPPLVHIASSHPQSGRKPRVFRNFYSFWDASPHIRGQPDGQSPRSWLDNSGCSSCNPRREPFQGRIHPRWTRQRLYCRHASTEPTTILTGKARQPTVQCQSCRFEE